MPGKENMKKIISLLCLTLFFLTLTGCRVVKIEEGERSPLEYTIMDPLQIPEEARELIEEKKETEFQLAYQKGGELYLIKGYGRQMCGGYSVQVAELSASSNGIFFETRLIGPSGEEQVGEPSYPYIAVKTEYRDVPVQFQ